MQWHFHYVGLGTSVNFTLHMLFLDVDVGECLVSVTLLVDCLYRDTIYHGVGSSHVGVLITVDVYGPEEEFLTFVYCGRLINSVLCGGLI
jgi:hypothetical protein